MKMKKMLLLLALAAGTASGAEVVRDVVYDPTHPAECRGDVYLPDGVSEGTPVALLIHGGGWRTGDRYSVSGIADFLRALGFLVFNVEYRLCGTAAWPACGDDCVAAGRFLLSKQFADRFNVKPSKIVTVGGSAGGHLALWTGLKLGSRASKIVSISGIGDPSKTLDLCGVMFERLLKAKPTPKRLAAIDPANLLGTDSPEILCTHAWDDSVVSFESSSAFAAACREKGVKCKVYAYDSHTEETTGGHCIWRVGSEPHRLAGHLEREIARFLTAGPVDVVAVYYPHWHVYPKGDEWFHAGWTEWEYVKDAKPRFPGHLQPMVPQTGYLDGKDPKDVAKEIDLAADAGINVFLYDYYYYGGKVTQEESLEEGFLQAQNRDRMKFALMWCYHDRYFGWRRRLHSPHRFVMKLERTPAEFLGLVDLSIERYFRRPEYWRRDGRLFFSIYDANVFVTSLGEDAARAALAEARRRVRAAGLGELEINAQNPWTMEDATRFKSVGFDSLTHYSGKPIRDLKSRYAAGERIFDYADVGEELKKRYDEFSKAELPYYPSVSVGWDSTPRCCHEEPFPWKGTASEYPHTMTLTNCTAALFGKYLSQARKFAEEDPKHPGVVYINAWNEYTEGCYLLPDNFEGDARLNAIRKVFGPSSGNPAWTSRTSP